MAVRTSGFTSSALESRLRDLNSTMQSIQGVSQWLIQHKKHSKTIVGVWFREIQKASPSRKLTLLYLANDVIQNSKRKSPEFKSEFTRALPRALHLVAKDRKDESVSKSINRIISVWEERRVFDSETLGKFKSIISSSSQRRTKSESEVKLYSLDAHADLKATPIDDSSPPPPDEPPNDKKIPEPEELLKKMVAVDGENSSVEDMSTRQKIASFPSELYDANILTKLTDKETGEHLLEELEKALEILSGYTSRMKAEVEERKDIHETMDTFIWHQQKLLYDAKTKQKEYRHKMEQCMVVREVLKSHIAALPNLATPSSEGLAPLPSAGDLFS